MKPHPFAPLYAVILWLTVLAPPARAQNLIVNASFESGNEAFTSMYQYSPTDLWPEGRYAILTNPRNAHVNYFSMGDHTTGKGRMLVVNGSTTASRVLWRQTVRTEREQTDLFSAWAANVITNLPGTFVFRVNGTTLQPQMTLPLTAGKWQNFSTLWDSSMATAATLEILFTSTAAGGNDSALDDLMFRKTSLAPVGAEAFSAVLFEWPSTLGVDYQVQSSIDFTNWFSVGTPIPGTGLKISYSEKATSPRTFFRVIGLR